MDKKFNLADSEESKEYLLAGGREICGEVVVSGVQIAAKIITKRIKKKKRMATPLTQLFANDYQTPLKCCFFRNPQNPKCLTTIS